MVGDAVHGVGEHVEVVLDDGTKRPARVQMVQVDALINLVTGYGAQAAMNQGNLKGAVDEIATLQGPAAQAAAGQVGGRIGGRGCGR